MIVDESKRPIEKAQVTVTSGNAANFVAQRGGNYIANLSDRKPLTISIKKEGFKTMTQVIEPQFGAGQRIMEVEMERNIPISMSTVVVAPTPEYTGLVIDGATGEPLEGVVVRLTNQVTNTQTEKTTNARGRFSFQMAADAQMLLTFSSEKFVVAQKVVKAKDQTSKYIGEIALKPSDVTDKFAIAEDKKKPVKVGSADAPAGGGYSIQAMPGGVKNIPSVPQAPKEVTPAQTKGEPAFAVQVAVSTSKEVLNLTKFNNLKKIGNVYVVPEDGKQKIRLGVYHTRVAADSAVKSAIALNYEGVFVTQEKNAAAVAENMLKAMPKSAPQRVAPIPKAIPDQYSTVAVGSKAVEPPALKVETTVKPKVEDKAFKVKIAAMKKPDLFNDEKVATLWKVEQFKEGEWTVFVMDGFKTLEQAKEMKKKVQATGYKDAKVVVRDGEKLRVVD